jgi:uncharacterized protein YjiS (DUF1127 family)
MAAQRISFEYIELPQLEASFLQRLFAPIRRWRERSAQREALARMDARMLQDIGITEADVWLHTRGRRYFIQD